MANFIGRRPGRKTCGNDSSFYFARSKGMTEIAKKTGLGRQALYNALSDTGNPTLETLTAVLDALGLELTVQKPAV